MKGFLRQIAQKFYSEYGEGNHLSEFLFVFPNRRPGLFFKKYLSELATKPMFSPQILTINELFQQFTSLKQEDNIALLFRLFESFKKVVHADEEFDQFVSWGQMLLNDFNDIDNYYVDARKLFQNIVEEKEILARFDFLDENSEEFQIIKRFWKNIPLEKERKIYTQNFISIWSKLFELYETFKQSLLNDGVAYAGMLCRDAVENLENREVEISSTKVVFVGFNALNGTEKKLFQIFKERVTADFYWDNCSKIFFDGESASSAVRFLQKNIQLFPSKFSLESKDQQKEKFEVISLPSSVAQAKQVYEIIENLYTKECDKSSLIETAIVLPDEKLLLPQLYSLPKSILKKNDREEDVCVNVTMGYPLSIVPINSLVEYLFELHRNARSKDNVIQFYFKNVLTILRHPYVYSEEVKNLINIIVKEKKFWIELSFFEQTELLKEIFNIVEESSFVEYLSRVIRSLQSVWVEGENDLEKAFAYCYITILNRVKEQIDKAKIYFSLPTLYLILKQLVKSEKFPFEGEPLSGLQIMGVLETRSLDFENVIITSLNEDIFPKKQSVDSTIPYAFRKAFGLPTYEHQDALQSYYFYRLIASAKRVFLLYDSRTDISDHGEMSRFIYQLCYHYNWIEIGNEKKMSYSVSSKNENPIEVKKNEQVIEKLKKIRFSATALNDYLHCPLKFYFSKVVEIKDSNELSEEIENDVFGSIVHSTLESLYKGFNEKNVEEKDIDIILKNESEIESCLNKAFAKEYLNKKEDEKVELKGRFRLIAEIIKTYVKIALNFDKKNVPFKYLGSEKEIKVDFSTGKQKVEFYGKIDRLHQKDGKKIVVDYKTGSSKKMKFDNVDSLFERPRTKKDLDAIFQTFFYALLLSLSGEEGTLQPNVYYIRSLSNDDYSPLISCGSSDVEDFTAVRQEFVDKLKELIDEIFDEERPFSQAEKNSEVCKYCMCKKICGREKDKYDF